MEHFEEVAFTFTSLPTVPFFFKRYVDDIFAVVETGKEETLLDHFNNIFPGQITLTMEKERVNRLPFLDVLVQKERGIFTTRVYRKPTHSGRYLHFTSHHPLSVKRVDTLRNEALEQRGLKIGSLGNRKSALPKEIAVKPILLRPTAIFQNCAHAPTHRNHVRALTKVE
uniref:Reverse transcriptase domain-containing protein n=1 Tax=Trichuris muris TaxID=70415 RepID=A0A5S6QDG5_TRIMR